MNVVLLLLQFGHMGLDDAFLVLEGLLKELVPGVENEKLLQSVT